MNSSISWSYQKTQFSNLILWGNLPSFSLRLIVDLDKVVLSITCGKRTKSSFVFISQSKSSIACIVVAATSVPSISTFRAGTPRRGGVRGEGPLGGAGGTQSDPFRARGGSKGHPLQRSIPSISISSSVSALLMGRGKTMCSNGLKLVASNCMVPRLTLLHSSFAKPLSTLDDKVAPRCHRRRRCVGRGETCVWCVVRVVVLSR